MQAPEIEQALQRNQELAAALEIRGTPAFVVGEKLVPGAASAEALLGIVASERERMKQARAQGTETNKN
jgi:protein-disulfide isomerase